MPEDTIVYVFQDNNGKWLAALDEDEVKTYVTAAFENQAIETMTLADLCRRDPHAHVRARSQYYWASDLISGTVRGEVV